ncbi:MAG: transposase [Candidatus Cloacimonetes bacterium]|nr:transposase [Candidatus Cloacimonadota bacterium]
MHYHKRRLPHIYIKHQSVFITWRLTFSLPRSLLVKYGQLRSKYAAETQGLSEEYRKMQDYQNHKRIFGWLDEQYGKIDLPDRQLISPEIAQILMSKILEHQDDSYHVKALCIMPNHVHVLMIPYCVSADLRNHVSNILKKWKGSTARSINLTLNRTGQLWVRESYDHITRSAAEEARIIDYIIQNPVKAGLVERWNDWQHTWLDEELSKCLQEV